MMKRKKDRNYKRIGMCCIVVILLAILGRWSARAFFSESMAVHIRPGEIEDGTLIIGTHLIHISALTNSIYSIAQASASDSGQSNVYYKSELAGGVWMDITDASNLSDISSSGSIAEDYVIAGLWLTHHTKSDKVTYDLLNGNSVNPFMISDPYNIEDFSELAELKMQYEQMADREDLTDIEKEVLNKIKDFFAKDLETDKTKEYDRILENLEWYRKHVAELEETDLLNLLDQIMEAVDAMRRSAVYGQMLEYGINNLMVEVQELGNDTLLNTLSSALQGISEKYNEYSAKGLEEGSGIIGSFKYNTTQALFEEAEERRYDAADLVLWDLYYLDNIENNVVGIKSSELKLLEESLIPFAEEMFGEAVTNGVSGEYIVLHSEGNAQKSELQELLKVQKNNAAIIRMELQLIIQAAFDRRAEQSELITEKQSVIEGWKKGVLQDAFAEYANQLIQDYQDWLMQLSSTVGTGTTDREQLEAKREEYLRLKAAALDENDLAAALSYDAVIDGLDEMINRMGGGRQLTITQLKDKAILCIDSMEFEDALSYLESITEFMESNRVEVIDALKEVYQYLNVLLNLADLTDDKHGSIVNMTAWIEEFIAQHAYSLSEGFGTEEILDFINEQLGVSVYHANAGEQAAAVIALHMYGKHTQDNKIKEMAAAMAENVKGAGNSYFFRKLEGTIQYVPTKTIGSCLGYRYVFNDTEKKVTLSKKGIHYVFYANSKQVDKDGVVYDFMNYAAEFYTTLYIDEEYAYQTFGCQSVYLEKTSLGILGDDAIMSQAEELFDLIVEEGSDK